MTEMTVTGLDDAIVARLEARARARNMSLDAFARETLSKAAQPTLEEKLALVRRMQDWSTQARNPEVPQTLGVDLIRESRDLDH